MGLSEGDGCDSGGGVVADALQFFQTLEIARELATLELNDLSCAFVKVSRSGVVAQSLPQLQHFFFGGFGKIGEGRPSLDETDEIVISLIYTCLL